MQRKIVWMHIILTWWTLLITIWICFVAFILCNGMRDQFDGNKPYLIRNNPLTAVTCMFQKCYTHNKCAKTKISILLNIFVFFSISVLFNLLFLRYNVL